MVKYIKITDAERLVPTVINSAGIQRMLCRLEVIIIIPVGTQ